MRDAGARKTAGTVTVEAENRVGRPQEDRRQGPARVRVIEQTDQRIVAECAVKCAASANSEARIYDTGGGLAEFNPEGATRAGINSRTFGESQRRRHVRSEERDAP